MNESFTLNTNIVEKTFYETILFKYYEYEDNPKPIGVHLLSFLHKNKIITIENIEQFYKEIIIKENNLHPIIKNIDTKGFTPEMLKELDTAIKEINGNI